MPSPYAAVILAGGAGRRLGGAGKPALPVGGRPMLHRVLAAVADASARVVVGPVTLPLPAGVARTQEDPPGGGPVAAAAAGLALVPAGTGYVALLAADLPLLTTAAVRALREATAGPGLDGALYLDEAGNRQWLCGVWRAARLAAALPAAPHQALRATLGTLRFAELRHRPGEPPPWWDCDTEAAVQRAEELMLEQWLVAACESLGLDPAEAPQALVLDLAREAAHQVVRPAAPVTTYLLGVAVGRGADPVEAAATLTDLARSWPPPARGG